MIYPLAHSNCKYAAYITFSSVYVFIYLFLRLLNKTTKAMGELDDLFSKKFCHLGRKMYILKAEEKSWNNWTSPVASTILKFSSWFQALTTTCYGIWHLKKLKRSNLEKGVQILSKHIIRFSLVSTKKAHPLLLMKYYIWKLKLLCWKIFVWLQKLCIFRVFFFLEWLKPCSSSVLLITVLTMVLVMESLQAGTQKALGLNACKWEEMKLGEAEVQLWLWFSGQRQFPPFCSSGTW